MASKPSLYLAGPDVFEPDAVSRFEAMKRICRRHGLTGRSPYDNEPTIASGLDGALAIFDANVRLLRGCDAVIANLAPFRGPSTDVGTALEIGMAFVLGLPIFGYSRACADYRVKVAPGQGCHPRAGDGRLYGPDGFSVEDFGLFDNLMIVGVIERSGGTLILGEEDHRAIGPGGDLDLFERAVAAAAERLLLAQP